MKKKQDNEEVDNKEKKKSHHGEYQPSHDLPKDEFGFVSMEREQYLNYLTHKTVKKEGGLKFRASISFRLQRPKTLINERKYSSAVRAL